ncbi:MAG: energy-coupling factor transporter transmembrane protein EcfT [Oscillospiraceae bacterium]|jgi:energy-coupling factor transport system permease protein|nr:energy-coupling factor transporter transmembrane protein EcfT [Oscillospiraceae bacterium]
MSNRDTFSSYHPAVNMLYFTAVLLLAMLLMQPVCQVISVVSAFAYSVYLNGGKAIRFSLAYMLPMLIMAALINPAFNHQGGTILTYLPSGNPLTLESILYGISAALMIVTVITWFSCYNAVMTSDKFVYLFGRVIPALSLILSMALRFVPRFNTQIKFVAHAQRCIGRDTSSGNIFQRVRKGIRIISIMVTWALENAIETADSMKARGYGLPRRTAFSIYRFERRDLYAAVYIVVCAAAIIAGAVTGALYYRYFPTFRMARDGGTIVASFIYAALSAMPMAINFREGRKWKLIAQRS